MYARRLSVLAERHLSRRVAARVDGEDVVQSALRTFFRRHEAGEFRIDSSGELWGLLAKITVLKARKAARYHTARPRDVGHEIPSDDALQAGVLAREPRPGDLMTLMDQIQALVRGLPELHSTVLEMRLQGHKVPNIASELGVSRRTVERALGELKKRLDQSNGG